MVVGVVDRHSEPLDVVAVGGKNYLTEFVGGVGVVAEDFFMVINKKTLHNDEYFENLIDALSFGLIVLWFVVLFYSIFSFTEYNLQRFCSKILNPLPRL